MFLAVNDSSAGRHDLIIQPITHPAHMANDGVERNEHAFPVISEFSENVYS